MTYIDHTYDTPEEWAYFCAHQFDNWTEEQKAMGRGYRGHDKGLGYEHLLRGETGYGQMVPALELGQGMDTGIYGGWTLRW